jgi:hypothetical protein
MRQSLSAVLVEAGRPAERKTNLAGEGMALLESFVCARHHRSTLANGGGRKGTGQKYSFSTHETKATFSAGEPFSNRELAVRGFVPSGRRSCPLNRTFPRADKEVSRKAASRNVPRVVAKGLVPSSVPLPAAGHQTWRWCHPAHV